jgi:hypothetical protein
MTVRYYSSVAPPTVLTAGVGPGDSSIQVASTVGFPSLTPYTLSLSYDTMGEELVQVNSVGGLTLGVTRGIDGTSTTSHGAGSEVRHVTSARDFADSRSHENSDEGIHGLSPGDVLVGENKGQSLFNKTLVMADGTLNSIDIFNGVNWVTTVNGNASSPSMDILSAKNNPSGQSVWKVTGSGAQMQINTAANDANPNQYKFRITRNNGIDDVIYMLAGGSIKTQLANGVDGISVQGSADGVRRDAFRVSAFSGTPRTSIYTDGTMRITSDGPTQRTLDITSSVGQIENVIRVQSSGGTPLMTLSNAGNLDINGSINPGNMRAGLALMPAPGAGGGTSSLSVTFSSPMNGTPVVTLTPSSAANPQTDIIRAYADNRTSTGFTIQCYRSANQTSALSWTAVVPL